LGVVGVGKLLPPCHKTAHDTHTNDATHPAEYITPECQNYLEKISRNMKWCDHGKFW